MSAVLQSTPEAIWRSRLDQMRSHPPPPGFSEGDWHQLKLDAFRLLETHGAELVALGWTTLDLFGLHRTHPGNRVSHSGLARFLYGGAIAELTDRHARIRHRTGSVLTFIRVDAQPGAVPAWALHQPQQEGTTEMAEYTMDLDGAPATNGDGRYPPAGGDPGPYLRWHAQPTNDGMFAAGDFSLRDRDGTGILKLSEGAVFDWPSSRTGWMLSQPGQSPERRWNTSRTKFAPKPDKANMWRRAIWIELAYDTDARCLWEQSGESAWLSYCDLMALIRDTALAELPKLPLLAHAGHKEFPMARGSATVATWRLLRYVPRPLCLPEHAADSGSGAVLAMPARPAPSGGGLDDEIPF
jgi:hypothetical protein